MKLIKKAIFRILEFIIVFIASVVIFFTLSYITKWGDYGKGKYYVCILIFTMLSGYRTFRYKKINSALNAYYFTIFSTVPFWTLSIVSTIEDGTPLFYFSIIWSFLLPCVSLLLIKRNFRIYSYQVLKVIGFAVGRFVDTMGEMPDNNKDEWFYADGSLRSGKKNQLGNRVDSFTGEHFDYKGKKIKGRNW